MDQIQVRTLRGMRVRGRPVAAGIVLNLSPRDALDACSGGRAEPVNVDAYEKAIEALSAEALRIAGPVRERRWPRVA